MNRRMALNWTAAWPLQVAPRHKAKAKNAQGVGGAEDDASSSEDSLTIAGQECAAGALFALAANPDNQVE